jgi:predicted GH43/DUF377 family glycosyl hydrolase
MHMERLANNPLLTPADVKPTRDDLTVMCALNPAAVRFGDEVLLLVRVGEAAGREEGHVSVLTFNADSGGTEVRRISLDDPDLDASDPRKLAYRGRMLLTSMSHLRIARSTDGRHFAFDAEPAIYPATPYEEFGCEDARITLIEGVYHVTYTAVSARGVAVAMASTTDFRTFRREGIIFPPYQKDVCLFPRRVGGQYVCRHRPYMSEFNDACIWTARSPDLRCWGMHEMTLAPTPGTWEAARVGAGTPPIRTDEGWLEIYHAADASGRYHLGAMLSGLDSPERIVSRSSRPVLSPEADYELKGVFANCVFSNGLIVGDGGEMTVYYGAADRICAGAVTTVDEMVAAARS